MSKYESKNTVNKFSYNSLEELRNRMLDLSRNNVLLNYKHPARSLRLVNTSLNNIGQALFSQNKLVINGFIEPSINELLKTEKFTFVNKDTGERIAQKPKAKQWAEYNGINSSYDLKVNFLNDDKENSHDDEASINSVQTIYYNDQLDAKIRQIISAAKSSIEEMGTNTLFLALGFLEWYESAESDVPNLAPLFNIPINIKRESSKKSLSKSYKISLNDEEIQTNLTLSEKMLNDFGLRLPDIAAEMLPAQYLKLVQDTITDIKPRWKVKYYATVTLLNFSKQAMYRDLDPKNWSGNALEKHSVLSLLFGGSIHENDSSFKIDEEYAIDSIKQVHQKFPLVYDADSSQHSALIDALAGKNIVIEGPPGSGKSQTITNLIASALNNNKKILFVAEKMAALNVVKSKLDNVGLGSFCLELHSHKTNKLSTIQDLNEQIERFSHYSNAKDFEVTIQRYESYKQQLNEYVTLINQPFKSTNRSIYMILTRATRLRLEIDVPIENIVYDKTNIDELNDAVIYQSLELASIFEKEYLKITAQSQQGNPKRHPWYGIMKTSFFDYEREQLLTILLGWNQQLSSLQDSWRVLTQSLSLNEYKIENDNLEDNLNILAQALLHFNTLPDISDVIKLNKLIYLETQPDQILNFLSKYEALKEAEKNLSLIIVPETIHNSIRLQEFNTALTIIESLISSPSLTLEKLANESEKIIALLRRTDALEHSFNSIKQNSPQGIEAALSVSLNSFKELKVLVRLIEELPAELWPYRDPIYNSPSLDIVLPQLVKVFTELDPLHKQLSDFFDLTNLPTSAHLKQHNTILKQGGLFKWFSSSWRTSKQAVLSLSSLPSVTITQIQPHLKLLISYKELLDKARAISEKNPSMAQLFQGADTPLKRVVQLRNWYKMVRAEYGASFGDRVSIGTTLLNLDQNLAVSLTNAYHNHFEGETSYIEQELESLGKVFPTLIPTKGHTIKKVDLQGDNSPIKELSIKLNNSLKELKQQIIVKKIFLVDLRVTNEKAHNFLREKQIINTFLENNIFLQDDFPKIESEVKFSDEVSDSYRQTIVFFSQLRKIPSVYEFIKVDPNVRRYQGIQSLIKIAYNAYYEAQQLENQFYNCGEGNQEEWRSHVGNSLSGLLIRNKAALDNKTTLGDWQLYWQSTQDLLKAGFASIIDSFESGQFTIEHFVDMVELVLYNDLSQDIFNTHEMLKDFSSSKHLNASEKFREYDKKILELQSTQIAHNASQTNLPRGNNGALVNSKTDLALIKYEAQKKTKHIALRELLDRSAQAVQALKPCFMMSPMSVAQYLKPGEFEFDLVIMDEASQIFPEDAIGAIARGRNIVIVGDPKQLPPSNFFKSMANNDGNSQETIALQEAESILDAVSPIFTKRTLKWHYRSRHESLIAFSNRHFYDSKLVLFPSPFNVSNEFGIKHHPVSGVFEEGINNMEAIAVVDLLVEQLKSKTGETFGIVAMNSRQRETIENFLELKLKEDELFSDAYSDYGKHNVEDIFIKNLENVQGDERDVIIISMTYGPNQQGARVLQRFGPINNEGGWRRLNVLFTRSRKRMHIISSMGSADILIGTGSKKGVESLKAFLEYCEKGHLTETKLTGRAPDSDFEVAVMSKLKQQGYDCEPQVGVAGFFIDLAVKNPSRPSEFIMGIECDGATYHSAKSARDRDRLRQEILEGLGWRIERIWSTDWFRNPADQIRRIINILDSLDIKRNTKEIDRFPEVAFESNSESIILEDGHQRLAVKKDCVEKLELDLRSQLLVLREQSVRNNPELADDKRLLRDEMLESLLAEMPCDLDEFKASIPLELRHGTSPTESGYLEKALRLIDRYEL